MKVNIEPWAKKAFELIFHAEHHWRRREDYDKRLALISFDNSIEVSISIYLSLHPTQRKGREYPRDDVQKWKRNYHTKLDFFSQELVTRKLPVYTKQERIVWLHEQRNELYHGSSGGVPAIDTIEEMRYVALWVYQILFDDPEIENLLNDAINAKPESEPLAPKIDSSPMIEAFSNKLPDLQSANVLIGTAILGRWDDKNEFDLEVINRLTDDFSIWDQGLREIVLKEDSPVNLQSGRYWSVVNQGASLELLRQRLFDKDLDLIKEICTDVLSEVDPKFDLDPDQRNMASIYDKKLCFSTQLREGLSETLVWIGVNNERLTNCSRNKRESTVLLVVRELFTGANWKLWASLNNFLPVLAEAAPNEFLNVVEAAFIEKPSPFEELFKQEGDALSGSNCLTGLYWGLEGLAWHDEYLTRVCSLLGALASIDPGGHSANRPVNSLVSILLPWHVQTLAPIEKRMAAIKTLRHHSKNVAWEVLLGLLPTGRGYTSGTNKPKWRKPLEKDWKPKITQKEFADHVDRYGAIIVEMASENLSWAKELVEKIENLPPKQIEVFLTYLGSDEITSMDEGERSVIWRKLTRVVLKHKKFGDSDWTLKEEIVEKIEAVADKIKPEEKYNLTMHLFSNRDFDLYGDTDNFDEENKKLENKRIAAIKDLVSNNGIEFIYLFADEVESPTTLGVTLGRLDNGDIDMKILPEKLLDPGENQRELVGNFIWGRFFKSGWEWVDGLEISNWTREQLVQFLLYLPFKSGTWERVQKWLGDSENCYWKEVHANPYIAKSDLTPAVEKLLLFGRPLAAVECLCVMNRENKEFNSQLSVMALMDLLKSDELKSNLSSYHITDLIESLQNDSSASDDDLFKIEYGYLPLLDRHHGSSPKFLFLKIAKEPEFFCELIRIIYKSKKEIFVDSVSDDRKQELVTNVWRLLSEWETPPGLDASGGFDESELEVWIDKVKLISLETGHIEVTLQKIGEILFYALEDGSAYLSKRKVLSILENRDHVNMREGFSMQIYNSRGAHWVDPTGKPEFELAEKWNKQAKIIEQEGFTLFANTLYGVSESFRRDGERVLDENSSDEPVR